MVCGLASGGRARAGAPERHASLHELDAEVAETRIDPDGVITGDMVLEREGVTSAVVVVADLATSDIRETSLLMQRIASVVESDVQVNHAGVARERLVPVNVDRLFARSSVVTSVMDSAGVRGGEVTIRVGGLLLGGRNV